MLPRQNRCSQRIDFKNTLCQSENPQSRSAPFAYSNMKVKSSQLYGETDIKKKKKKKIDTYSFIGYTCIILFINQSYIHRSVCTKVDTINYSKLFKVRSWGLLSRSSYRAFSLLPPDLHSAKFHVDLGKEIGSNLIF